MSPSSHQRKRSIYLIAVLALAIGTTVFLSKSSAHDARSLRTLTRRKSADRDVNQQTSLSAKGRRKPTDSLRSFLDSLFSITNPDVKKDAGLPPPEIVWLVGYPLIGDVVTRFLWYTNWLTETPTATNIANSMIKENGDEFKPNFDSIPVYSDKPGPFYTTLADKPQKYVLTRTQGHGACQDCHPDEYLGFAGQSLYMHSNTKGVMIKDNSEYIFEYDINLVKKMVIMIEDPTDILTAFYIRKWNAEKEKGNTEFTSKFSMSPDGIRRYCQDRNKNAPYLEEEKHWYQRLGIWEETENVLCRSDFVKIFTYYNNARVLAVQQNLEMKVIHAEDFVGSCKQEVMDDVFNFIEVDRVKPTNTLKCFWNQCDNCYTKQEYDAISRLGRKMLLPALQDGFQRYWR